MISTEGEGAMEKEKIVVIAGTVWQIPLIKRLKEKGYFVVDFNLYPDSPAFQYADDFRIVDILDYEACSRYAEEIAPKAVLSDECDIATPSVTHVSERLGLKSIGSDMAELYTNKALMRKFGEKNGFATPRYFECGTAEQAVQAFHMLHTKMIMKPIDSNSSRGVYTIYDEKDIRRNFQNSMMYSKGEKKILLEEYIDGTEFTVDGIKTDLGHVSLAVSEKKHYSFNENIACSLYFSYTNDRFDYEKLRDINDRFVNLSGLPYGLTHAEYKYKDGQFYLIEIGARGGGNLISAEIVPLISGVDNYGYLIDKTVGEKCDEKIYIDEKMKSRCAVLKFFDSPDQSGILRKIIGEDFLKENEKVISYNINCQVGDKIVPAEDDSKRIGYYIAYGESREELDQLMQQIEDTFELIVEA